MIFVNIRTNKEGFIRQITAQGEKASFQEIK
jgi:hypothetical protein